MVRLTRAEAQERNRARVLAAARAEFAERGFREAKIDTIAERAELTRGAVYSNFPGKRALYFAVLADDAAAVPVPPPARSATVADALGALARAWVARLPLATDADEPAWLGVDLVPEVIADDRVRRPYAQLKRLDAIVLGLALERLGRRPRQVRLAETALTLLHGSGQLAAAAPGFGEPFNVVRACEQLADLDLDDHWPLPPLVAPVRAAGAPWQPPSAVDELRGTPAGPHDGVVAVLGLHRLSAVEEAIRAGVEVTAVLVTGQPDELAALARLSLAELRNKLRHAVPPEAWPRLRLVVDETGAVAAAAGVDAVSDATETAVRVEHGRVVARADGWGACHAAATYRA
ncbi:TetR family transcriptional regulator [Dactylosporangium roseum]|uniref:TetR family transcriptional regulator n=1 Tax=Dactylosporangium roseum TaxID=47989 RepID=A0ABY5YYN5_9ACTN|nr:TetR/AcrR family transcriptional regulator [Dactylosporangium roseum]UWZ33762.1 TetR family transcriptional regulator [Dactylosporangium roseum]